MEHPGTAPVPVREALDLAEARAKAFVGAATRETVTREEEDEQTRELAANGAAFFLHCTRAVCYALADVSAIISASARAER